MMDFIKRLQAKPPHVRERVAYGAAAGITALVALVWLTTSLTTQGILAPELSAGAYFAQHQASNAVVQNADPASGYLGAAAAAATGAQGTSAPHLQVVNAHTSAITIATTSTSTQTVIPF